jgi:hypothetical protein
LISVIIVFSCLILSFFFLKLRGELCCAAVVRVVLRPADMAVAATPRHVSGAVWLVLATLPFSPQAALQATFFPVGVFPRPCILTNDTHGT